MKSVMRIANQLFRPFLAIVFCALLMLPSKALAIYPSGGGLPDIGLDRSLQGSDQATEALKEKYPEELYFSINESNYEQKIAEILNTVLSLKNFEEVSKNRKASLKHTGLKKHKIVQYS